MFAQGAQIQVKHDIYLAWLYVCASLFSSLDAVLPPPATVNAEWPLPCAAQTFQAYS